MGVSAEGLALRSGPSFWPALRPLTQVGGFGAIYLVASLLCAVPIALATGRSVLGIWYILPFTLIFLVAYQKLVHSEGLRELGLDPAAPCLRLTVLGFFGCGLGTLAIQAVQREIGWMEIRSNNVLPRDPEVVIAGLGLALALNFGVGLGEELVFRGYVLRRLLLGYRSPAPGVLISAAVFSAAHVQKAHDPLLLLNLFLLGTVLALAVVLTGSVWCSVGIHMGWDFWSDGIYFVPLLGPRVFRVLSYSYHLQTWDQLLAFKVVSALALLVAAGQLTRCVRARALVPAFEEGGL